MRFIQRLNYFSYNFPETEDNIMKKRKFEAFIDGNLKELFSSAEAQGIVIPLRIVDIESVINAKGRTRKTSGSYRQTLISLSNTITMQASNHSKHKNRHQQEIFAVIIAQATSFQKLINLIKEYLRNLTSDSFEWNVVYYSRYEQMAIEMSTPR